MNTKSEARPVAGDLGPKQQEAVNGPDTDAGPPIQQFICRVCQGKFFDMKHYFYGVNSDRCLWCEKYGKVAKKATKQVVDPKS